MADQLLALFLRRGQQPVHAVVQRLREAQVTTAAGAPAHANGHGRPVTLASLPERGPASGWPKRAKPGRRRPDGRTAFIVVALLNAAQVAAVAFSGSWQHQYELSVRLGQARWVAAMQPLSVEGLISGATLVIWYAARYGYAKRDAWAAYLVLAAGVGQTVLMNLGAGYRWPWLGPEISVWPAVAFVAAYEMAVWLVRKRQDTETRPPSYVGADDASATPRAEKISAGSRVDNAQGKMDNRVDKQADKRTGIDAARRPSGRGQRRTALDKAAAAIRDNPGLTDKAALARIAGVSAKSVQRVMNGTAKI